MGTPARGGGEENASGAFVFTDGFYEVQLRGMDVISSEVCGHVVTFNTPYKSSIQGYEGR